MTTHPRRRGLPRRAGGDPWPPAEATATLASAPHAAARLFASRPCVDADARVRQGLPHIAGGGSWPPRAAQPEGASSLQAYPGHAAPGGRAPGGGSAETAPTAARLGLDAVRRGLPRSPGGEPWPPTSLETRVVVESAARADAAGSAPTAATHAAAAAVETDTGAVRVTCERPLSPVARAVRDGARVGAVAETAPTGAPVRAWPRALSSLAAAVAVVMVAFLVVTAARLLLSTDGMRDFLDAYPGEYEPPHAAEPGIPAWARWQHYLNFFFMLLIVRSGLQVRRQKKPPAYWTSKRGPKISITLWFHQLLDVVWLLNGAAFVVLLFATGHWVRIVPTSWEVVPNAVSAALQYVSFDWPTENGWVTYNALQQLVYFAVVFAAAPLAALSGVRMSGIWPTRATRLNRLYPVELARAIHYPTMLFFVAFVVFHVGLVLTTGALRNLNHMFAGRDAVDWVGAGVFAVSLAALAAVWAAARPVVIAPIASLFGRVSER